MTGNCVRCGAHFESERPWGLYCSQRCCRQASRQRQTDRDRAKVGKPPVVRLPKTPRPCAFCGTVIPSPRATQQFCRESCRYGAGYTRKTTAHKPKRRRLKCKWCSGNHMSADCTNRSGTGLVRQFGTMDENREYVPPPGVKVTIRHLPHNVFGEDLKAQAGGRFGR